MLSLKRVAKILQDADFVIVVHDEGTRDVASFVGWEEEGDEDSDFIVGTDRIDDISFGAGLRFEMQSHPDGLKRGFYLDRCWVFPVKAGRA